MNKSFQTAIVGGIIGGFMFGIMMQMMGMIQMVGKMVGSESIVISWLLHMIISVLFGIGFMVLIKFISNLFIASMIYGVLIWILGPLLIMPMMLGMGNMLGNAFEPAQLMSLMTHIIFSVILAIVYKIMDKKTMNNHVSA